MQRWRVPCYTYHVCYTGCQYIVLWPCTTLRHLEPRVLRVTPVLLGAMCNTVSMRLVCYTRARGGVLHLHIRRRWCYTRVSKSRDAAPDHEFMVSHLEPRCCVLHLCGPASCVTLQSVAEVLQSNYILGVLHLPIYYHVCYTGDNVRRICNLPGQFRCCTWRWVLHLTLVHGVLHICIVMCHTSLWICCV